MEAIKKGVADCRTGWMLERRRKQSYEVLIERADLIEKLFKSLHLALARVPGALAVATIVTCAIFATATGIVGAVVTLMGLLAFPQMLKGGYLSLIHI